MWYYSARKMAAIVALSSAMIADEAKYSCVGKTNNPHWSRGTGGCYR